MDLQKYGKTNLTSLQQKENGMRLCTLCHPPLDSIELPSWVFVPSNLDFFIEFEKEDFRRRMSDYKPNGEFPVRRCPPVELYRNTGGGLYDAYMLREHGPKNGNWRPGRSTYLPHPKAWHGDPMVALFKGFIALGTHGFLLPRKLMILSRLYGRNDRGPREQVANPGLGDRDEGPDEDLDSGDGSSNASTAEPRPKRTNAKRDHLGGRSSDAQGHGGYVGGKKRGHVQQEGDPEPKRITFRRVPWVWGPEKSSADHAKYHNSLMKAVRRWQRDGKLGNPKPFIAQLPSHENSEVSAATMSYTRVDPAGLRKVLDWLSDLKPKRQASRVSSIGRRN
ncbi:MAG: hypothetical protein L6R39_007222 [Caloplaca ligustica]|nr:MAG: hypothetical protein L6R39_007222 [Caloplaca ligustica]